MTATLPIYIGVFWALKAFCTRTSQRLRVMDIESRAPLCSNLMEAMTGLVTIRAFGLQKKHREINYHNLCESQKPFYLLLTTQRWLTVTLDLVLAGFAVIIMGIGVGTMGQISPSSMGLALVNTISLGSSVKMLVTYWTGLEVSLGAISRAKHFIEETRSEHLQDETSLIVRDCKFQGPIRFNAVWAYYM
jgi:ABC-type multidrug transport system fused ATPase/permease subunit